MAQPQHILCPRCHKPARPSARFCQHCGHDVVLNNAGPRFYLTRVLKAGGQGAVFEGAGDDGKVYAVKEMLDNFADPKERAAGIARFEAEAGLLERLSHPRIPRVYAHFEDEGKHYLVMDFVRGEDLDSVVEREGAITEPRVLDWADQICEVLGYLHANGMIYRDMKPSNVMLEPGGTIKLIDFGIAKVLQGANRGTQIGTPGYAPPEQYQGIATRESDIYALGATLHHLLTGRNPQDHPPFSFPPARDVNPAVSRATSDAIARALQMRPEDRYGSLADFAAALGLGQPAPAVVRTSAPQPAGAARPAPASAQRPLPQPAAPPPRRPAPQPAPGRPAASPSSAQPQPAPPRQRRQPAPASQAAPAAPPVAQAPRQRARRSGCGRIIVGLLVLVLLGLGGAAFAIFQLADSVIPAPTAQTLVQQEYRREAEIIVPAGTDEAGLRSAFAYTYSVLVKEQFGDAAQVVPGSVAYAEGAAPAYLGADTRGERFRVTLVGQVLVPEQ